MKNILANPAYYIGMLLVCTAGIVIAISNIHDDIHISHQIISIIIFLVFMVYLLSRLNSFFKNLQPKPEHEHVYRWDGTLSKW